MELTPGADNDSGGGRAAIALPYSDRDGPVPRYRGYRRFNPRVRAVLPTPLRRVKVLAQFATAEAMRTLAQNAVLIGVSPKSGVVSKEMCAWTAFDLRACDMVRRSGSYPKARHNLGLHSRVCDGVAEHIWADSVLELMSMRELDRRLDVTWYHTQRVIVAWRLDGAHGMWHAPDLYLIMADGRLGLANVKSTAAKKASEFVRFQMRLMEMTCEVHGWVYEEYTDISLRRQLTLEEFQIWRGPLAPELALSAVRAMNARPSTLGGLIDLAGGQPNGHVIAMHLLAKGVCDTDLDRSLTMDSGLTWSPSGGLGD